MIKISTFLSTLLAFFGFIAGANAQCAAGEVAVTVDVTTDTWGYELYWEVTPEGDACGVNTIFSFGNPLVGCAGGGAQTAANGDAGAYPNTLTTTEDLGCITDGTCFSIHTVDDYADGQSVLAFTIDGIAADVINCVGAGEITTFCAIAAASFDAAISIGSGVEYTVVPVTQVSAPIGSSATITNAGSSDITGASFTSTVYDGAGSVVYMETSASIALVAVGASENATVAGFIPTAVDTYLIEYIVSISEGDLEFSNDTAMYSFVVSDSVYARDNGNVTGSLGIGDPEGIADQLGQSFEVTSLDTLSSVSIFIRNASGQMTGLPISATIYDVDPTTGAPLNEIASTEVVLVDQTQDSLYTCSIVNGLELAPGTYVVVANETGTNIELGTSDAIYTAGATWVIFGGNPWANSEDYGFPVVYLLRANFGEVVESTVGILENTNDNRVNIYPNPSTGNFTLDVSGMNTTIVDVNITDISGKVVMNESYNTFNGELSTPINISSVEEGIYIVRVNGNESIVKRIVVSNK